jgi:hypothetical protein
LPKRETFRTLTTGEESHAIRCIEVKARIKNESIRLPAIPP